MSDRKLLAIVLLAAVALSGFFFGILKPRAAEATGLRDQLLIAQDEELALNDRLARLRQLALDQPDIEADIVTMAGYLPKHAHVVRLVRLLTRASKRSGVDLRQIAPAAPSPNEAVAGSRIMHVSLTITGTYDRIEAFTAQLEQMERAVKVTSITFSPSQDDNGDVALTSSVNLRMYTFDAVEAASGASAEANPAPSDPDDSSEEAT